MAFERDLEISNFGAHAPDKWRRANIVRFLVSYCMHSAKSVRVPTSPLHAFQLGAEDPNPPIFFLFMIQTKEYPAIDPNKRK
jgi:hypothetical protein